MTAPLISVLHATRGRPEKCAAAMKAAIECAANPEAIEYLIGYDADDPTLNQLFSSLEAAAAPSLGRATLLDGAVEPGGGCVRAYNAAARRSSGAILCVMEDDLLLPNHWDSLILQAVGKRIDEPLVLRCWVQGKDMKRDRYHGWQVMTRARYEEQGGVFYAPEYKSVYGDTELYYRAVRDGICVDCENIVVIHEHPWLAPGKNAWDSTYEAENAKERYVEAAATFRRRNPEAQLP